MWQLMASAWWFLFPLLFWESAQAQENIAYIRLANQRVVLVRYRDHEYRQLQQVIADHHLEQVEEPDGIPAAYNNLSTFIAQISAGGMAAGWMLGSPQHLNHNVEMQPVAVNLAPMLLPYSYPIVCLNYFHHGECPNVLCHLVHLTIGEIDQVRKSAGYLSRSGDLVNPVICTQYYRGECQDPECQKLHILFDDQKIWRRDF